MTNCEKEIDMSGGHFNGSQYHIERIAEELERVIELNSEEPNYSSETIEEFRKGLDFLRKAHIYAQRIDWLLSGDDGEDSFHRRLAEDLGREPV